MNDNTNWYSQEQRKLLKKERYFTGSHHYFFEVKEAKNGSKYIIIDQRKKIGDEFIGSKIRVFEDEMSEFLRIFDDLVSFSLNEKRITNTHIIENKIEDNNKNLDLNPPFFRKLLTTQNWQEFEKYTYSLLKLLGINKIYSFFGQIQAGKADGFFKIGNLAVLYDCTLRISNIEENKYEQINNYCNQLQAGSISISTQIKEEFINYNKQVWIITQGNSKQIKVINNIKVKQVSVKDLIKIYEEYLTNINNYDSLEIRLYHL
ncbi:hypothetical protein [Cyanobacterium sp. Dongsha4]|uniref:hypothetical protein n=1 Tax=Cyanobacterium sp. DS4 TaxID=2878255 RepID=UPI002E807CD3|nr:hypothetical protein [Cyanobacterium sp. Dongsha4]WVK99857.1 hypothetical protein Dongsha4_14460 [Cyanobacterium sp. Dongsha4]